MQADVRVGPIVAADGTLVPVRAGKSGEMSVSDAHGRYYEAVSRGGVYLGGNSASQVLTLGTATATGLILTNPVGSGKNLSVLQVESFISAAVTAVANVALWAGTYSATAVTQTTAITPRNALITNPAGVGLLASSATLPAAPFLVKSLYGWHWVTAGTATAQLGGWFDIGGSILLPPGTSLSVQGLTVAHSAVSSIMWEEVAI